MVAVTFPIVQHNYIIGLWLACPFIVVINLLVRLLCHRFGGFIGFIGVSQSVYVPR